MSCWSWSTWSRTNIAASTPPSSPAASGRPLTLLMATLKKPRLLLLDEHTAALDPKTAAKVLDTTEKIVQAVAPTKREEMPPLKVTMLEEDLRPFFPDKRTTIPDVKQGILEGLKLRQTVMERQKAKPRRQKS